MFWLSFLGDPVGTHVWQEGEAEPGRNITNWGFPAAPICTVVARYLSIGRGIIWKIIKTKQVEREGERQSYLLIFLRCMFLKAEEAGRSRCFGLNP